MGNETKSPSQNTVVREEVLASLARLGGQLVQDDALIFRGTQFVLPEMMSGRIGDAIIYLKEYQKSQEQRYSFHRTFRYRPWDGAHAFQAALYEVFGTTGIGATTHGFFGAEYPPEMRSIQTSPDTTTQVPWGNVHFPPLEATFTLRGVSDPEFGQLFSLAVEAPRKYQRHIEAFFVVVENKLRTNSIYRGRAITGAEMPAFLDLSNIDPSKVVYSAEVLTQLNANLWSLLEHSEVMRDLGIPMKRAVLVEGPYGTGKTLAGALTARTAVANDWTFILCRPGKDDLLGVLQTAQLYAPAVVWYEDVDAINVDSDQELSNLLDALDGITNKGVDVVAGFTTNHVDHIQRAVLRPGRLDAVIHIGELDADGFRKLIEVSVPDSLLGEVDYTLVSKAFDGFLPAFAKEAIDRALRYSIARNGGKPDVIVTDDLVHAAEGLRPQLDLMSRATEGVKRDALSDAVRGELTTALESMAMVYDGDKDAYTFLNTN